MSRLRRKAVDRRRGQRRCRRRVDGGVVDIECGVVVNIVIVTGIDIVVTIEGGGIVA